MLVKYTPADTMLSPFFDDFFGSDVPATRADVAPRCDILERKDDFVIFAETPGVHKGDVKVEFQNGLLTIRGEKKIHDKVDGEKFYRVERVCGTFSRSFRLGEEIDTEKISAKYEDGVLSVILPKNTRAQAKSVDVQIQ